ncbi:MAG: histidine kinase [Gemmatimonadales bacterium]
MPFPPPDRPPVARLWLLSLAAWTLPAVLEAGQSLVQAHENGASVSWWEAYLRYGPKYYFWAALTPVVWAVARRVSQHRQAGRIRVFAIHAAADLVVSAAHLTLAAVYYYAFWNSQAERLGAVVRWYFANVFGFELLAYPVIVGAYHLIESHRAIRRQELTSARLEASLAEARFEALQQRLHPHFLFNALNALVGLLRSSRVPEAIRAIGELGHLLRDALDDTHGQERSLEEELEWAERYLAIEQLRVGPRLSIVVDIDEDVFEAAVPRLLLQPLLENAVRHGIVPCPSAGEVSLSARRAADDTLRIEIMDDGPGPAAGGAGTGVGLTNTRARLQHLYGARHRLILDSRPGKGARVTIDLPFRVAATPLPADAYAGGVAMP